jgi:hypothetical protein
MNRRFSKIDDRTSKGLFLLSSSIFLWVLYLTKNKIYFNSDSLFLEFLRNDIATGGSWSDWKLTVAPNFFPDALSYFLVALFTKDIGLRFHLTMVLQILWILGAILLYVRSYLTRLDWVVLTAVISIFNLILVVSLFSSNWMFLVIGTSNHTAALIAPLLLMSFMKSWLWKPRFMMIVVITVLNFLAIASTSVYIITFLTPLMIYLILKLISDYRHHSFGSLTKHFILFFALLISTLFFGVFRNIIVPNLETTERLNISAKGVLTSIISLVLSFDTIIFGGNILVLISFLLISSLCAIFTLYAYKYGLSKESNSLYLSLISNQEFSGTLKRIYFTMGSFLTTFVGAILSGGLIDNYGLRYFIFPITLVILLALEWILKKSSLDTSVFLVSSFSIVCSFLLIVFFSSNQQRYEKYNYVQLQSWAVANEPKELAQCINEINQRYPSKLRSGVADYWYARATVFWLSNNQKIIPVKRNLSPFYWMESSETFESVEEKINFLVVDQGGLEKGFGISLELGLANESSPSLVFPCPRARAKIFYFEGSKFNDFIRQRINSEL